MMATPIKLEVRAAVLAHRSHGLSHRKLVEQLFLSGMAATKGTFANVTWDIKWEQQGNVKSPKRLGNQGLPAVSLRATIRKVRNLVDRPDPWTLDCHFKEARSLWHNCLAYHPRGLVRGAVQKVEDPAQSDKMVQQRPRKAHVCYNVCMVRR